MHRRRHRRRGSGSTTSRCGPRAAGSRSCALDETSVRLCPSRSQGTIFRARGRAGLPAQRVAGWKRRCCLTHIGAARDNSELQPRRPQFILGSERTLKARAMAALRAACPPPCCAMGAWSSAVITAAAVRGNGRVLAASSDVVGGAHAVPLPDAVRMHFTSAVMTAFFECQVAPVCVHAKLTWLPQPP